MSKEALLTLYDYLAVHPLHIPTLSFHPLPSSFWESHPNPVFAWSQFLLTSSCPSTPTPASRIDLYQQRTPLHRRLHHLTADIVHDHTPTANRPQPIKSLSLPFPLLSLEPCPHNPDVSLALSFSSLSLVQLLCPDSTARPARKLKDGIVVDCSLLHFQREGGAGEATHFVPTCAVWHPHRPGWMLVGSGDGWCHVLNVMTSPHRAGVYESALIAQVGLSALTSSTQPLTACYSFHACTSAVRHIAFPPETSSAPHLLAVASGDGQVVIGSLLPDASAVSSSSSTSSSPHLLSSFNSSDRLRFSLLCSTQPHSESISFLSFCHPSPLLLCSSSKDGYVNLFDASSSSLPCLAHLPHPLPVHTAAVAPFLSPRGGLVLAAAFGAEVFVWEVMAERGEEKAADVGVDGGSLLLFVHRLHTAKVVALQWQDGQPWLLNSVDADGVLMVWEMNAACYDLTPPADTEEEQRRTGQKRLEVEQLSGHVKQRRRQREDRWALRAVELSRSAEGDGEVKHEQEKAEISEEEGHEEEDDDDSEDGAYGEDCSDDDGRSETRATESKGKAEGPALLRPLHRRGGRGRIECPYHVARKEPCPNSCAYRDAILRAKRKKRKERAEERVRPTLLLSTKDEPSLTPPSGYSVPMTPDAAQPPRLQLQAQRAVDARSDEARPSLSSASFPPPLCTRPGCDWMHPASQRCPELSSSSGEKPSQVSNPSQTSARAAAPPQPAKKQLQLSRPQEPPPPRLPLPIHHHQRSSSSSAAHRSQSLLMGSHAAGRPRAEAAKPAMQSPVKSRSEPLRPTPPSPVSKQSSVEQQQQQQGGRKRKAREEGGKSEKGERGESEGSKRKKDSAVPVPSGAGLSRVERRQWEQAQKKRQPVKWELDERE